MILRRHPIKDPALRKVTQGFGEHPDWYTQFGLKGHNGIDFGLPSGSVIQAVDDGIITEASYDPEGFGYYIKVTHTWGDSLSAHLTQPPAGKVDLNKKVKAGDVIAMSDNTGNSTGPHLHFGIRIKPFSRDDGWMGYSDPAPYLAEYAAAEKDQIREQAWNQHGIPYNPEAALSVYARANNLGVPMTQEFDVGEYRVQGYAGGIVYVIIGHWDQIAHLSW